MKVLRRLCFGVTAGLLIAVLPSLPVTASGPAGAVVDKAVLLSAMDTDQAAASGMVMQINHLGYLGIRRTAIAGDVGVAYSVVAQLRRKTIGDTQPAALNTDSAQFSRVHIILAALEGPKVDLATRANSGRADLYQNFGFVRTMEAAGGTDPRSPIFVATRAVESALRSAQSSLDQGISLLDASSMGRYPASLSSLNAAADAINRGLSALVTADELRAQDKLLAGSIINRYLARQRVISEERGLARLGNRVAADRNLTPGELANVLRQIAADQAAMRELDAFVVGAPNGASIDAELILLASQPGVFLLIAPKADIMLAAADDRAATRDLNAIIPNLFLRIAAATARHHDVTGVTALLDDLIRQLAAAGQEIDPISAQFQAMTAVTASDVSHDGVLIHNAKSDLTDANQRLAQAKNDALQIIASTP